MSLVEHDTAAGGPPEPEADILLTVEGIKVHFPIKRGVIFDKTIGYVYAVDGVDLKIRRGETYGLVGESGCGKSTLGRAILNLEPPTEGHVIFDGVDIASLKGEELRRKRQHLQMVFQDPLSSLDPRQSVESLLVEGMKAHGIAKDAKEARPRLRELLQTHEDPAQRRLAAAGLSHDAQRLAGAEVQVDAVDGLHVPHGAADHAVLDGVVLLQSPGGQDRVSHGRPPGRSGRRWPGRARRRGPGPAAGRAGRRCGRRPRRAGSAG